MQGGGPGAAIRGHWGQAPPRLQASAKQQQGSPFGRSGVDFNRTPVPGREQTLRRKEEEGWEAPHTLRTASASEHSACQDTVQSGSKFFSSCAGQTHGQEAPLRPGFPAGLEQPPASPHGPSELHSLFHNHE